MTTAASPRVPLLRALRERMPVSWWAEAQAIFLTRHAEVVGVLGDDAGYSADRRLWTQYVLSSEWELAHPVRRQSRGAGTVAAADPVRSRTLGWRFDVELTTIGSRFQRIESNCGKETN